jgi:SPP1 gp7 family putative phage head morphogenesis protein
VLQNKPGYYSRIDERLRRYFYDAFYLPLFEAIDVTPKLFQNAGPSPLLAAITRGSVVYQDGVFSGKFTMSMYSELSAFARFDSRSRKWFGRPGPGILSAAMTANAKRRDLLDRIRRRIDDLESRVDQTIKTLSFGLDLPLFSMDQAVLDTLPIGVVPTLDERTAEKLRKEYNESQKLNIKNWQPEQISRLRSVVEKYQTTASDEALTDVIMREWGVTANKATFLARQETSLFFSKFSRNRASDAGVRRYIWSTSHDERVRFSHKMLNGTEHGIDDPPVVDPKSGRRAHPGEDFGCRCAAKWVLK